MPKDEDANALHLISDILGKLIDSQQSNAETNAALKKTVEESVRGLDNINRHFSNGFKSELKQYVDQSLDKHLPVLQEHFDVLLANKFNALDKDVKDHFQKMFKTIGEDTLLSTINNIKEDVEDIKTSQHSWWFWIKHSGLFIIGFGTVMGFIIKIALWLHEGGMGNL